MRTASRDVPEAGMDHVHLGSPRVVCCLLPLPHDNSALLTIIWYFTDCQGLSEAAVKLSMGGALLLRQSCKSELPSLHGQWEQAGLRLRVAGGGACFLWNRRHITEFSPTPPTSPPPNNSPSVALWELVVPFRPNGSASRRGFTSYLSDLLCAGPRAGPKTVLLQRLEGQPATTRRRQMSRDPGSPTAEPSPQSGLSAFFEVSTPRFRPAGQAGRSTRDLHSTTVRLHLRTNIPTEHGMPTSHLALISSSKY
ncbi:hypothetical protein B0T18DRAFT_190262 [Schizothecium vesticola]|uniref:Uncharacterized protein n=1 Tax=Schizothecium vesticola TaxID=314040 RepID=A0AA40EQQ3_9PEZI|nr:hypothetical protein B0T18DRAFT_190262 [Schizothecium vesticola]